MREEPWSQLCAGSPPVAGGMVTDPLAQVARSACEGDAQAQRRLFEAVAPSLLAPLRIILGSRHPDLEDALQEALLGLLRGLGSFRGESSVLHYARRVAVKRAIEVRRRERTAARKIEHSRELHVAAPPTPGDAVVAIRRRQHLRDLLEELPGVQAETLAMKIVLGHSLEEIAEAMGAPVNTVRSRLRLAKEALRRRIDADPSLEELLEETP